MVFRYFHGEWFDLAGPHRLDSIPYSGQRETSDPVKQAAKAQPLST